jgi:hypothetical protein
MANEFDEPCRHLRVGAGTNAAAEKGDPYRSLR